MVKFKYIVAVSVLSVLLTGCIGPAEIPKYVEIKPNESAYVIPLEGASKADQGKFDSVDFLAQNKVATKRIYLSQRKISTGRFAHEYEWIPTVRVVTVNRSPVTFEWSGEQGIEVESKDSIGFTVGTNISAFVTEENTSEFLYNYPAGAMASVLNNIVKSKAIEILSREFAGYDLEGQPAVYDENGKLVSEEIMGARAAKGVIVEGARKELIDFFSRTGITISTFGLVGGLNYDDAAIQTAINDNFSSELAIVNKANEKLAQDEVNSMNVAVATAEAEAAEEFADAAEARIKQVNLEIELMEAKAKLVWAERWDGKLPANMMPDQSSMLMSLSK